MTAQERLADFYALLELAATDKTLLHEAKHEAKALVNGAIEECAEEVESWIATCEEDASWAKPGPTLRCVALALRKKKS